MCVFIGYILGPDKLSDEIECSSDFSKFRKFFYVILKYVAPIIITVIFIIGINIIKCFKKRLFIKHLYKIHN